MHGPSKFAYDPPAASIDHMTEADIEEFLAAEQTSVSINHDGEFVVEPSNPEACEITKPRVRSLHTSEDEGYLEVEFGVRMRLPRERMLVEGGDRGEQDDSHGGETWTDGSPATESSGPSPSANHQLDDGGAADGDSESDEDEGKITFSLQSGPADDPE